LDRNSLEQNYKKANIQLFHIECKKSRIKKEIYRIYYLYLTIVRSKLQNYLGEAIRALTDVPSHGISVKDKKIILFIKNDLKNIINKKLPFLTIEQLSINKGYKIDNEIKNNREFENNYNLIEEVNTTKNCETIYSIESMNYHNIYYKDLIDEDKSKNINIDSYFLEKKSYDYYKNVESLEFINFSILENDKNKDKLYLNNKKSQNSKYFIPIEFRDILKWIDTLETSLNFYLKDLSIEINDELLNRNILKRFVKNDFLTYIFENHLLLSNPLPFILSFDPSLNQYNNIEEINSEDKFLKINLINIDSAELEFFNINLNILKNKLLELRSNIYLLIKKEKYWCNKLKSNSNINSSIIKN
tara:strand:+ start:57 stop:1133 length:1077 start_codon:yes stop_codon:yes gene_type:complete